VTYSVSVEFIGKRQQFSSLNYVDGRPWGLNVDVSRFLRAHFSFLLFFFSDLLTEQCSPDAPIFILLSSDLHNSSFLVIKSSTSWMRLLPLVGLLLPNTLRPMSRSIPSYSNTWPIHLCLQYHICLKSFYLLRPCVNWTRRLFTCKLNLELKKRIIKCLGWTVRRTVCCRDGCVDVMM